MSSKFEFIDGEKANYPLLSMCRWLDVSRSGFYEWRNRPASATAQRRFWLAVQVRKAFVASRGTYGYRRVHAGGPSADGSGLGEVAVAAGKEAVSMVGVAATVGEHPRPVTPGHVTLVESPPGFGDHDEPVEAVRGRP